MSRFALTTRVLTVSVLGVMLCVGSAAVSQPAGGPPGGEQPRRQRGPGGDGREGRGASVEASMKGMSRAFRVLKTQIGDASKKEENLALIGEMERACVAAKSGRPGGAMMKAAKSEAEKAAVLTTFRTHLIAIAHAMLDLETQVMEGKTQEAVASVEKIQKLRVEGHHEMKEEGADDDKGERGEKGEKPGAK